MIEQSLGGKTVAIPETRLLDVFAGLLERRGANVVRCPLVGIHDTPDTDSVIHWVKRVNESGLDDLILLTGEGLRRIDGIVERCAPELKSRFIEQLAATRILTRGPKPAKALKELGLGHDLTAAEPTTAGVIQTLSQLDLAGRRVGVQLYGTYENPPLIDFLNTAGATIDTVAPYVYADEAEDAQVSALIEQIIDGQIDVIAFTSSPQIRRLLQIARKQEQDKLLRCALTDVTIAAVGPVVRGALIQHKLRCDLMPEDSYFLKPLVRALEERFAG